MNEDDRFGWMMLGLAGTILFLVLILSAREARPADIPTQAEACYKSAEAAQAFLQLTDEANGRALEGPPKSEGKDKTEEWATVQKELYGKVERVTGALEVYSSICIGVEIYPHRLPEDWRKEYENLMKQELRDS